MAESDELHTDEEEDDWEVEQDDDPSNLFQACTAEKEHGVVLFSDFSNYYGVGHF